MNGIKRYLCAQKVELIIFGAILYILLPVMIMNIEAVEGYRSPLETYFIGIAVLTVLVLVIISIYAEKVAKVKAEAKKKYQTENVKLYETKRHFVLATESEDYLLKKSNINSISFEDDKITITERYLSIAGIGIKPSFDERYHVIDSQNGDVVQRLLEFQKLQIDTLTPFQKLMRSSYAPVLVIFAGILVIMVIILATQ